MDLAPLFARIEDADRGIRPQVIETPLDRSRMLSDTLGIDVWLKADHLQPTGRSEEHTSELQSLMRISYAVFCLKKKTNKKNRELTKSTDITENNQYNIILR